MKGLHLGDSHASFARIFSLTVLIILALLLAPGVHYAYASPARQEENPPTPSNTPTPIRPETTPHATPSLYGVGELPMALNAYMSETDILGPYALNPPHISDGWAYVIGEKRDQDGDTPSYEFVVIVGRYAPRTGWEFRSPIGHSPGEYNSLLARLPDSLLDEATKAFLTIPDSDAVQSNFSGFLLPWPGSIWATVTQKDGQYHENQVDFNVFGTQASGDIYASKPGRVVFVKESSDSGACDFAEWPKANMVVIQHGESEYSWYVHLEHDSVPVKVNDYVNFGTKIGVEGNTGFSCGVHLHYMASTGHTAWTDPQNPNSAPWATGTTRVDFDEVAWQDMVVGNAYISSNFDPGCPQSTGVILYDLPYFNCGHEEAGLGYIESSQMGAQNVPSSFDDAASSMRVPHSHSVRLYELPDLQGEEVCINADDVDFGLGSFEGGLVPLDNQVSSFEVFIDRNCYYGEHTIGVFNSTAGRFFLKDSHSAGPPDHVIRFGAADQGWLPVAGDWDDDDTDTIGVYNPSKGRFLLRNTNASGPPDLIVRFGPAGQDWVPLVGDWDGDGTDTVGVYDPSRGLFMLSNSHTPSVPDQRFFFGPSNRGWIPIAGDWDRDGADSIGVYNPATAEFRLRNAVSPGWPDEIILFGPKDPSWRPVVGDWDMDGLPGIGLYHPDYAQFRLKDQIETGGLDRAFRFGAAGLDWLPIAGDWDGS